MMVLFLAVAGLLAGCVRPDLSGGDLPLPATPTATPGSTGVITADPAQPQTLLTQPTDAGLLHLIRYQGRQGLCVALTFDPQTLAANHCGLQVGAGVGFVEALTAPDGRVVRVVFGLTPTDTVTAVAVEFISGANTPAHVGNGGYVLMLADGQTPRRATAIDQYGYMAGQWGF